MIRSLRWLCDDHNRLIRLPAGWLLRASSYSDVAWGIGGQFDVWHPGLSVHVGPVSLGAYLIPPGEWEDEDVAGAEF